MKYSLTLLALSCLCIAYAQEVTILSPLDTRADADQFASRVRLALVEPVREPRTEGDGAMRIRFMLHPSADGVGMVEARDHRNGLRYRNWTPYQTLAVDLLNPGADAVEINLVIGNRDTEFLRPATLEPGKWTTVEVALADAAAASVDLSDVQRMGIQIPVLTRPRPTEVIVDNPRLIGADAEAIKAARDVEDERNRTVPERPRVRTEAALQVVRPEPTGEKIRRCVDAPVIATPEVLVVGGGMAGVAAAVTAARMGAEVLLVERSGSLGGMATLGLVPPAMNVGLTQGITREFVDRLRAVGGPDQTWNPEVIKYVLLDMMRQSGAKLMLYSLAVGAIVEDGACRGIIVENKSGTQAIRAKVVIDCTGDGDVAAWSGAHFEIGRGRDNETQTHTLVFLLANVDTARLLPTVRDIPEMIRKARSEGKYKATFAGGAAIQPIVTGTHGAVNVNMINVPEVDGLKVEDLTYSHVEALREALDLVPFFREYVPGCEECYLAGTAEFIGVRESRRIIGEYTLTGEEALSGAVFPDAIARGFYPIDIHSPDGTGDASGARPGKPYDIPYGCLVPLQVENLLVAGRPISVDHVAHGSVRVMGTTMSLGEAAGCAAALCLLEGVTPRQLAGERVRATLEQLGGLPDYGTFVPPNLASAESGTIASSDSNFAKGGYAPHGAIDGLITRDQLSRWLSGDGPEAHWLQLDFPEPRTISQARLYFYSHEGSGDLLQYVPQRFEIQIPEDDGWRTVATSPDVLQVNPRLEFGPVTTKTMRVLFTRPNMTDNIVRLREIVVLGPGGEKP